jgi:formylglycine-generating enzyme required for sulfatase activity
VTINADNYETPTDDFMRTKLHAFFIVLAMFASLHSAFAQVTNLGIAPAAGGQSVLYWPTSSTMNYVLQMTTNLGSPNWVTATNAVTVNAVMVTNSAPSGYFRLLVSTNPPGMVLIPAGSFTIGNYLVNNFYNTATNDPDITDANPTNVYVSAFYMDVNLVSYSQWQTVYAYAANQDYGFDSGDGLGKAATHPVQTVDWYDCVKWCNARSQQAGLTPCYYTNAGFTQVYKTGDVDAVYVNWAANGFRLPTEAEWEKAARGGVTGNRFPWGNVITEDQANYQAFPALSSYDLGPYTGYNTNYNTGGYPYTSPVGSFAPNGYGLYDMAGNVWEWCWDWYAGPPYPAGSPYLGGGNPTGAGPGSGLRVLRGGRWYGGAGGLRCANRLDAADPTDADSSNGFRCVRGL